MAKSRLFSMLSFSSSTLAKNPHSRSAIIQGSKLHNGRIYGFTSNPTLLFSRTHKRAHSSSNFGLTQMKFYHKQGSYSTNPLRDYLFSKGKWGFWVWTHRVNVSIVGSCVLISFILGNWETVPYTKRMHFVPLSDVFDDWLSKNEFDKYKTEYKSHILNPKHPTSKRIYKITKDVLGAMHKDLELDKGSMALTYAATWTHTKKKLKRGKKPWGVRRRERKAGKHHLDGMHWEVVVVDMPIVNAFCLPNGKIVVFTGLLKVCKSDDEIATIIGHEVGHVVARHVSERLMRILWFLTIILIISQFVSLNSEGNGKLIEHVQKFLIEYPLSRRREAEADHIGLMLMAAAGYDPQKAPNVYKNLESDKNEFLSTHPSGKRRAAMLSKKKMEEAMAVYDKVKSELKQD